MKKILFILRDGFDAKYIEHEMQKYEIDDCSISFIIESGKTAKKKKLARMFKSINIFCYPKICFDLFVLLLYSNFMISKMQRKLGKYYRYSTTYIKVDDINEERCIKQIRAELPDMIFIYGTGIVKQKTMESVAVPMYNIHSSILPYYRNVHSDFWAFKNKDYDKIGITLFKLSTGIDDGEILLQMPANQQLRKLYEFKCENLQNIPHVVCNFLNNPYIEAKKQDENVMSMSYTPTALDILKFILGI